MLRPAQAYCWPSQEMVFFVREWLKRTSTRIELQSFRSDFEALTGYVPFRWQKRLFLRLAKGDFPSAVDIPTGLGKTAAMILWLIARARGAPVPRRLIYVVDRRAVVD